MATELSSPVHPVDQNLPEQGRAAAADLEKQVLPWPRARLPARIRMLRR